MFLKHASPLTFTTAELAKKYHVPVAILAKTDYPELLQIFCGCRRPLRYYTLSRNNGTTDETYQILA